MNKKVALYGRVSSAESTGRQDPEVQLSQLREYCKQRGFIIHKEYVDHMSGSKDDRPSLNALMNEARKRRIDIVLVWKFDRFARSTKALVLALEEFRQLGVDFISFSENIDTSTAMGKAMFTMISAMAEFERSLIQERVCAGLQRAKDKGVRLGRPQVGFDANKAVQLKRGGSSWDQMAKALGVSKSTLRRVMPALLKNPRK
jgi:DNA invertase Pin-like site-specific DNA recombinase